MGRLSALVWLPAALMALGIAWAVLGRQGWRGFGEPED